MTNRYYRVLSTKAHFEHFSQQKRNSFNASVPGDWIDVWSKTKSVDEAKYPLNASGGPYAPAARSAFLRLVPKYKAGAIWDESDRLRASELDGLCAYRTQQDAIAYGNGGFQDRYLVLSGRENGQCAEGANSVLLVDWNVLDAPLTLDEFLRRYP